jgi:hypothetical protein
LTYDRQEAQPAVEPRMAGRWQRRQHPSVRTGHLGARLQGPGAAASALHRSHLAAITDSHREARQ